MTKVVLDTNIVVSAAITTHGKPATILKLCFTEKLQVYYATSIINEYIRVLSYKHLNIPNTMKFDIISAIIEAGEFLNPIPSTIPLPDETDRVFYDTAKASGAILITGNIKHYPNEPFIKTPSDFLEFINYD